MKSTIITDRKTIYIETKPSTKTTFSKWLDEALRRLLDVVGASVWLLLLSPAFMLIGIAIRRDSAGPVFYRGRRAGRGGKEFGMLKFRTMYEEENGHNGAKITAQDDPRITPTGKWLRDNKLNELPQLWNVLKGDMSFVGPRPEDPDLVKGWSEEDQRILLSVRPGMTSPATIVYRDEEKLLSSSNLMQDYVEEILPTKLRLDKLYLRNRSVITDLDVIFWTAITLLPNVRTLDVPQQDLFWGPVSRITFRYLSWLVIDTVIAFLAVGTTGVIWRISGPLDVGIDKSILYALVMSTLFSLANWLLGLNRMEWSRAPARNVVKLGLSTMLATGVLLVVDSIIPVARHLPEAMIIFSGVLAFAGFTVMRYRERLLTGTGTKWLKARGGLHRVGERVLIIGGGENGALASWIFDNTSMGKAFNVMGIVDDDPCKQGLSIDGYDVLGTSGAISEIVSTQDIGLIVCTIDNFQSEQRARILSICQKTGVKVVALPDILDIMRKEFEVSDLAVPHPEVRLEKVELDIFLREVQELLETDQHEEAQRKLIALRNKI